MGVRGALLACAFACGGAQRSEWRFSDELAAARDGAAMRNLVHDSITNGGLWFADAACAREFAEPGHIAADRVGAFAACLAQLHLRPSARRDALPDVVVLEYEPGFEVEARLVDRQITWIGYSARLETDLLPSVSARALEALRVAGDRDGPIADPGAKARAWLKVCIDEAGAVTTAQPREITSTRGTSAFVAAIEQWRFKPFAIGGSAIPVCALRS